MRNPDRPTVISRPALFAVAWLAAGLLTLLLGCSVDVKKNDAGEDKNVDIRTPVGSVHLGEDVTAQDTGLPVYPGARQASKKDGDQNPANVNISTSFFRLKVVAVEYESADAPDRLVAYYQDKLKKYGNVLECHTSGDGSDLGNSLTVDDRSGSRELKCEGNPGTHIELKAGSKDNQHVVSISPASGGKGSSFALVYVQTRGKEGSI